MKYHKYHPIGPRDGRERIAMIELTVKEMGGLLMTLEATINDPELKKDGRVFLSFENRACTDDPAINCYFDKVDP